MRLPDVIGIGTRRCATSWLHDCLNQHPEIGKPRDGIHFFSENWSQGVAWYAEQLARCAEGKSLLEFSVSYSYPEFYREAARRMAGCVPDAKLFLVVRNPVDRAFSDYMRSLRLMEIDAKVSFEEAVKKWPVFLERGMYARVVDCYRDFYPRERILLLFFDDLKRDSRLFLDGFFEYIGVSKHAFSNCKANTSGFARPVPIHSAQRMFCRASDMISRFAKRLGWMRIWQNWCGKVQHIYYKVVFLKTCEIKLSDDTRRRLQKVFEKDIHRLEEITDRDLSGWL